MFILCNHSLEFYHPIEWYAKEKAGKELSAVMDLQFVTFFEITSSIKTIKSIQRVFKKKINSNKKNRYFF